MAKKLYIETHGCQMNEYDSSRMVDLLGEHQALEVTARAEDADVILLNTCSIRERAQDRVYSQLGRWRELKLANPEMVIAVGGCVASQEGAAIRDRAPEVDALTSLQDMAFRLCDDRAPLSGLSARSVPFFRTIASSPALTARARAIGSELQATLADELSQDPAVDGVLLAAFFIAGYSAVLVETAHRRIEGEPDEAVAKDHRARLERLFTALRDGVVAH